MGRERRDPGDPAISTRDRGERSILDRQIAVRESGDSFAEGERHQRRFDQDKVCIRQRDFHGGTLRVDRVVGGTGGSGAGVSRGVRIARVVDGDQVGGVGHVGMGCEHRDPGDPAISTRDRGERSILGSQIAVRETSDRFAEEEFHQRRFARKERRVRDDDDHHAGTLRVDRVVLRTGGSGARVPSGVRIARVVDGDQVGGVGDAGKGCERRGPGDAAIATRDRGEERSILDGQIAVCESGDCFAEGERHLRRFADDQRRIRDGDVHGGTLCVDRVVRGTGGSGPRVPRGVRIARVVDGDQVSGVEQVGMGCEKRGPADPAIATRDSGQCSILDSEIAVVEAGHGFAEEEFHQRRFANDQAAIEQEDIHRWSRPDLQRVGAGMVTGFVPCPCDRVVENVPETRDTHIVPPLRLKCDTEEGLIEIPLWCWPGGLDVSRQLVSVGIEDPEHTVGQSARPDGIEVEQNGLPGRHIKGEQIDIEFVVENSVHAGVQGDKWGLADLIARIDRRGEDAVDAPAHAGR